ncbi:MAG: flagellar biosynthesis anti-sigma factor FlgM [Rhodocyclaceae bacterium]|nr:flagellar biosynthesis anti-sigma factor FlgM [Rhodocyclaceae bacterium]
MKINTAIPAVGKAPDSVRAKNAAGPAAASPQSAAGTAARVDISSLSAHMQKVGAGETPVNAERVAEIKAAISEGRFQINPESIADGLLTSVREMLGRPHAAN